VAVVRSCARWRFPAGRGRERAAGLASLLGVSEQALLRNEFLGVRYRVRRVGCALPVQNLVQNARPTAASVCANAIVLARSGSGWVACGAAES
jgi:hypothetical protein